MKTTAVVPPYGEVWSETRTFWRWASRIDHEEAESVGVGELELGGLGEPEVGVEQGVGVHAEATVVDLQGEAVGDPLAEDLDGGVRGREHRGVLEEFGDEVGEVRDGGAADAEAGQSPYLDALVVLDLRDGGADHVHELDGLAPLPGGGRAGEDDEALGVAGAYGWSGGRAGTGRPARRCPRCAVPWCRGG